MINEKTHVNFNLNEFAVNPKYFFGYHQSVHLFQIQFKQIREILRTILIRRDPKSSWETFSKRLSQCLHLNFNPNEFAANSKYFICRSRFVSPNESRLLILIFSLLYNFIIPLILKQVKLQTIPQIIKMYNFIKFLNLNIFRTLFFIIWQVL